MNKHIIDLTVKEIYEVGTRCVLITMTSFLPIPLCYPGQFAELLINGVSGIILRRPISIHFFDSVKNEIGFLVQIVGAGTNQLAQLKSGDIVNTLLPLGNRFKIPDCKSSKLLLIGGGVGMAPIYFLGRQLKEQGYDFTFLLGARSQNELFRYSEFLELGKTEFTTEDGSCGEKGYVTNHSILKEKFDYIYTCGPKPMMMAVANYAKTNNIHCEVSLENKMACGLGACLCCVEDTKTGNRCVCTEGPVFSIDELKW